MSSNVYKNMFTSINIVMCLEVYFHVHRHIYICMSISKICMFLSKFMCLQVYLYTIPCQSPHICPPGPFPGKGPTPALNISITYIYIIIYERIQPVVLISLSFTWVILNNGINHL